MTGPRPHDPRTHSRLLAEEREWRRTCEEFRRAGWGSPEPQPCANLLRWPWILAGLCIAGALISARAWGVI